MKKVSVVVPIYNVEKFIERCLRSILNQTYQEFEIICVDDCGQDRSMEIVEDIRKQFPEKIRIVSNGKNAGLGAARDAGIRSAKGDYIAFIDSDDYIKSDYLAKYMEAAEETAPDIIVGGFIRDVNGKCTELPIDTKDTTFVWTNVSTCTKLFRMKFIRANHLSFKGVRRYEDEGFMYRSLVCQPKVVLLAYSGYYYYMNTESITKNKRGSRADIFSEYAITTEKLLESLSCSSSEQELLNYCLVSGLTANLLYNGQGAGRTRMAELYGRYDELVKKIDQNICKNKYIAFRYLKSEPAKKRYATWLILRARKIKMDRLLFLLDGML